MSASQYLGRCWSAERIHKPKGSITLIYFTEVQCVSALLVCAEEFFVLASARILLLTTLRWHSSDVLKTSPPFPPESSRWSEGYKNSFGLGTGDVQESTFCNGPWSRGSMWMMSPGGRCNHMRYVTEVKQWLASLQVKCVDCLAGRKHLCALHL